MSLAAHKFHGPRGIGALILRPECALAPILFGGFQQEGLRPGTESVALAVGLSRALELWAEESDARQQRMTSLRDQLEERHSGRNARRGDQRRRRCTPSPHNKSVFSGN